MQAIFSALEVSDLLRCHEETVEELLRLGELPGIKIGRSWIVPADALNQRLTEMALSQSESRRSRRQVRPQYAAGLTESTQGRGRRPKVPPKLPDLSELEKLLRQR